MYDFLSIDFLLQINVGTLIQTYFGIPQPQSNTSHRGSDSTGTRSSPCTGSVPQHFSCSYRNNVFLFSDYLYTRGVLPAQTGQPAPCVRDLMLACHSWPRTQRHQTFRFEPLVTSPGDSGPFLFGCHCAANRGDTVSRSFFPGITTLPAQIGQPFPSTRELILALHSCPSLHFHQTDR